MNRFKHLTPLIKAAAAQSIQQGKLSPTKVKNFTASFAKLPHAEAVFALSEYLKILNQAISQTTLTIESPTPLSQADIDRIQQSFSQDHQIFETQVINNPSLLGGIRVKIGDDVYEDSIQSRIEQLKTIINS